MLFLSPTSLQCKLISKAEDYGLKAGIKKAEPFLILPSPSDNKSKANFLPTYRFFMFVYSILEEKDMIGILPRIFFPTFQCMCFKNNSVKL